jgi:histidyl-tRNA synthetase
VAVISADDRAQKKCLELSHQLRLKNIRVEMPGSGNVGKKMKRANKVGAQFAVIIGESELQSGSLTFKDLGTGEQKLLSEAELLRFFAQFGLG